jgi:TRAP-type C4-dicarboxylate transport system substrate-binding protein
LLTALIGIGLCIPVPGTAGTPGIVVANTGGKDTLQFRHWQDFRKNVDDRSNGSILLDYLIFGELGSADAMLQAVISGRADIGSFGCSGATQTMPELAVTSMPFLFDSDDEADHVFDKFLLPLFTRVADEHGLVLLQWSDNSWVDFYSRGPVQLPAQLERQLVRTSSNISGPDYVRALGAIPVELSPSDLAGTIQGQKVFGGFGSVSGFARLLKDDYKFYTRTHQSYNCGIVVANKDWFQTNTPREQAILKTAFTSPADIRRQVEEQSRRDFAVLAQAGVKIIDLTPEEHNAWAAVGLPLYPEILRQAGGRGVEVYEAIRAGKRDFLRLPQNER